MHFAVDHLWSNQDTRYDMVLHKEQRVVRVALFLNRILRYVVGLLPSLVPLSSFVILPARSHSCD